jgi:hypothetical protein
MQQTRLTGLPLESCEQNDVSARRVHLVTFSGMNGLFLHSVNLQTLQFHIEHLTQVHNDRFMNLLPKMSPENLDQTDF